MDLAELLQHTVDNKASDLHLTMGQPPMVRVSGRLIPGGYDTELGPDDTKALIYSILTDDQKAKFEEEHELDFSIGITGVSRFRVNVFMQRGSVAGVFRTIGESIPTFEDLGADRDRAGTGPAAARSGAASLDPTGCGKSTTLAAVDQSHQPGARRRTSSRSKIRSSFVHRPQPLHREPTRARLRHAFFPQAL